MTFSLSVFVALVVLLPGFGLFAGLYAQSSGAFRPVPPPPTSFTALGLVVFGACIGHILGLAFALWVMEAPWMGGRLGPSPYLALTELTGSKPFTETHILTFVLMTLLIGALLFGLTRAVVILDAGRGRKSWLTGFFYGWLAELVIKARPANRYVNVYVVCDMPHGENWLGYEGTLASLSVSADKEIQSLLLADARSFRISFDAEGPHQRTMLRAEPIGRLHIARDQIVNIAFDIYERRG